MARAECGQREFVGRGQGWILTRETPQIRGRNVHPEDVEREARAALPADRELKCAALTLREQGEDKLAVLLEVDAHTRDQELESAVDAVRRRMTHGH
jgi:hypothetical protein